MQSRLIAALVAGMLLAGLAPARAEGQAAKPPLQKQDAAVAAQQARVMEFLARRARRMAAQLPPIPDDLVSWEKRRDVVRRQLAEGLGLPSREPMRARTHATRREGELIVEDVIYLWAERAYVSANVVRPADAAPRKPLPALVMPPGWLGELKYEYYKTFVDQMARRGCLTIFIDDPHVGKRTAPCAGLYGAAAAAGTQVMGIQVFDTLRALDYALARSDVDPKRIGVAGLCQGSEQAWLAAALEDRFQIAVPVCGTTTYEGWAQMPFTVPHDLSDPSPYVGGVLRYTDWHEINACIAPRPVFIASNSGDIWWPVAGYDKVVGTLDKTFRLFGKPDRFRHLRDLRSHSMTPFIPELAPWIDRNLKDLPASAAVTPEPVAEPVDPDFSMLGYCQRRIIRQTEALPAAFASKEAWRQYRERTVTWLAETCDVKALRLTSPTAPSVTVRDGLILERLELPQAEGLRVPVAVFRPASSSTQARPAVLLSLDSGQLPGDAAAVSIAGTLARDGCVVCVPQHMTVAQEGRPRLGVSFYGAADTVGIPPLALRVWDDLAALEYLPQRADVDKRQIAVVGLGVGGVDAAITTALDRRVAACGVVGATTVRDWAAEVAPKADPFDRILPYLPDLALRTDWQYVYAAAAPRPLLLVDVTDRANWPEAAYQRVRNTAEHVYALEGSPKALSAAAAKSLLGIEELRTWLDATLRRDNLR